MCAVRRHTCAGVLRGGVCQLEQPATARVDGEHLAKSIRVRPERIGGGQKERTRPGDIQERARRVAAAKVRELGEIRAVSKEELGDLLVAIPSLARPRDRRARVGAVYAEVPPHRRLEVRCQARMDSR